MVSTVSTRQIVLQPHLGQTLGALAGDVLEMRGATADHRAQGDDGIVVPARRQASGHQRHLEGARHPHDLQVAPLGPVTHQAVDGTREQAVDHEAVEARHQQGDARVPDGQAAFDFGDVGHFMLILYCLDKF